MPEKQLKGCRGEEQAGRLGPGEANGEVEKPLALLTMNQMMHAADVEAEAEAVTPSMKVKVSLK